MASVGKELPLGIWAYYSNGTLKSYTDADSSAIGVAVITSDVAFVISKDDGGLRYYGGNNKYLGGIGVVVTSNLSTAQQDYDGEGNTSKIIDALVGYNDGSTTGSPAASTCKSGFSNSGHMGSVGEWTAAYTNKSSIDSMMSKIGGTAIKTNYAYWTSTLYNNSDKTWRIHWNTGGFSAYYRNNRLYTRAFLSL